MSTAKSSKDANSLSVVPLCCDPPIPQNWDRCHVYLTKKKRFCRQRPQPPSVYCGNHQHLDSTLTTSTTTPRKRIACPVDPSHVIFEDMVHKHILVCPRAKKRKRQTEQMYFHRNINSGGHGPLKSENSSEGQMIGTQEWAKRLALRVLAVHHSLFWQNRHLPDNRISKKKTPPFSPKNLTWDDLHDSIPLQDLSGPERDAGIVEGFHSHRIKSGGARHIPQLASLVGHLRKIHVLPPLKPASLSTQHCTSSETKPLVFLEMGAGRGMFGLTAAGVAAANDLPTRLVMVERTGSRSKADKIFRTAPTNAPSLQEGLTKPYLNLRSIKWSRIECDLAHVHLPTVLDSGVDDLALSGIIDKTGQGIEKHKIVVIAKHLCGAGTDLAIKSMEPIREQVHACVLATCCHGICDWNEYVGREFLSQVMTTLECPFGPEEFNLMRRWCAGSVASVAHGSKISRPESKRNPSDTKENDEDDFEHGSQKVACDDVNDDLETVEKQRNSAATVNISAIVESLGLQCGVQGLGRACQRLMDYGRKKYLQEVIFSGTESKLSSEICHYVSPQISPQNACIVCCRR